MDIISDEGIKAILEAIIEKLNEECDNSERIKHLYKEVQGYIPEDSKYYEKYWVAAYILYTYKSDWENFIKELYWENFIQELNGINVNEDKQEDEADIVERQLGYNITYEIFGPPTGYRIMREILKEIIKNTDYNNERFERLYYEMQKIILSECDCDDKLCFCNYKQEQFVAIKNSENDEFCLSEKLKF